MSSGIRSNYSYDENDESLSASMDGVAALPTSQERHTVLDKLGDSAGSRPVDAEGKLFIIVYFVLPRFLTHQILYFPKMIKGL
jgi:hypothetical protein